MTITQHEIDLRRMQDRQDASFETEPDDIGAIRGLVFAIVITLGVLALCVGFIVAASYAVEWGAVALERFSAGEVK